MVDSCSIQVGWRSVNSATTTGDFSGFLKAVDVWIERPHVVNRRLMGALIVQRTSVEHLTSKDIERSVKLLVDDQGKYLFQGNCDKERETTKHDDIYVITKSNAGEANVVESCGKENYSGTRVCEKDRDTVLVRKLLPKQLDRKDAIFELVILGKCIYYPVSKYSTSGYRKLPKVANPRTKLRFNSNLIQEKMRGRRGRLPVQPLGYVMSTKVIFRRAEVFVLAEVCLPRRLYAGQPRSDV